MLKVHLDELPVGDVDAVKAHFDGLRVAGLEPECNAPYLFLHARAYALGRPDKRQTAELTGRLRQALRAIPPCIVKLVVGSLTRQDDCPVAIHDLLEGFCLDDTSHDLVLEHYDAEARVRAERGADKMLSGMVFRHYPQSLEEKLLALLATESS